MSLIMVNNKKIKKTKNSLRSGINISIGFCLVLLTAFFGLKGGVGATLTVVEVVVSVTGF